MTPGVYYYSSSASSMAFIFCLPRRLFNGERDHFGGVAPWIDIQPLRSMEPASLAPFSICRKRKY